MRQQRESAEETIQWGVKRSCRLDVLSAALPFLARPAFALLSVF